MTAATALTGASHTTSADATGRTGVGTREAVAEGKYWRTRTLQVMTHPRQVGRGDNKYWLVERRLSETWTLRDGRAWTTFRRLGATPKSAADRAAWKRDGSPRKWSYRTEGMLLELSMEPQKGRVIPPRPPHGWFLGYTRLTFEELQAAPTDPKELKTWLHKLYSTPGEPPIDPSADLPSAYADLMHRLPAPKAVRMAAYQLLSQMPGATVTDAGKGRKKVTEHSERPNTKARHARIIDTRDLLLVGTELDTIHNGKQLNAKTWTTDVKSGWTDNEPAAS
ncbi:hypothetical protein ACBJ59_14970 [Nonomuraea sp. MTCD27]|uniref:hypothetical protein n=1 Tax=Nonomuraea sp. MTCD27 TaxID=1676747 RepID=UPI0035C0F3E1